MRSDCKWYLKSVKEETCGHGYYDAKFTFIHENLMPCIDDCKGYYNQDEYFNELKNPKEYLKKYGDLSK